MWEKTKHRVAVLYGGSSPERPISLKSGAAVSGALRERGWDIVEIDVGPDLPERLRAERVDVAWLALHGPMGEDGCVQGLLEVMRVPYTGSGVRGSAVAMDKIATKRMLRGLVEMPADRVWRRGDPFPEGLRFPVMAKTPERPAASWLSAEIQAGGAGRLPPKAGRPQTAATPVGRSAAVMSYPAEI